MDDRNMEEKEIKRLQRQAVAAHMMYAASEIVYKDVAVNKFRSKFPDGRITKLQVITNLGLIVDIIYLIIALIKNIDGFRKRYKSDEDA